jgi:hypothetical protein
MKKFLLGLAAGFLAVTGLALASATVGASYFGWNPSNGLEATHGTPQDGAAAPLVLGGTCGGSYTTNAVGAWTFDVTANTTATTCPLTVSLPLPTPSVALGGVQGLAAYKVYCIAIDVTTPADTVTWASGTSKTATLAGTVAHSDEIIGHCWAL